MFASRVGVGCLCAVSRKFECEQSSLDWSKQGCSKPFN